MGMGYFHSTESRGCFVLAPRTSTLHVGIRPKRAGAPSGSSGSGRGKAIETSATENAGGTGTARALREGPRVFAPLRGVLSSPLRPRDTQCFETDRERSSGFVSVFTGRSARDSDTERETQNGGA
jgi:hypothetical protein